MCKIQRVSSQSKRLRRSVEPRRGAGRRDLGTRAGASMCKIQRVSSQSKRLRRSVEPRRGAGRRDLGTRVRRYIQTYHPQKEREAAPSENHLSPEITKLPPRAPAPNKANPIFALHGRVLLGEVLGERGRFGGSEPPRRKRGLSPSKVFPRSFPSHARNPHEDAEKRY